MHRSNFIINKEMERIVKLVFVLLSCLSVHAQHKVSVNVIKSVAMGTLKLEESEGTYYMLVETDNRYHPFVSVILGDSTEAVRLLTYMSELKLGKNDRGVYLENMSENVIMKGPLGAFNIYEKTVTICGVAHRLNIKKLLKALTEGGRERKPAYRRHDED